MAGTGIIGCRPPGSSGSGWIVRQQACARPGSGAASCPVAVVRPQPWRRSSMNWCPDMGRPWSRAGVAARRTLAGPSATAPVARLGAVTAAPLGLAHVNLGDLPTWLGVAAASVAAAFVFLQLRSQQQEIARQTLVLERQQADMVDIQQFWQSELAPEGVSAAGLTGKEYWHATEVTNQSRRPIRDVAARFEPSPGAKVLAPTVIARFAVGPESTSGRRNRSLVKSYKRSTVTLAPAGTSWSFVFPCVASATDQVRTFVRFTDDADLHWQRGSTRTCTSGKSGAATGESR
jgi:hypothetical protein